jgi:hypothetical protein
MSEFTNINFKLLTKDLNALENLAEKLGLTLTSVVRSAIDLYLSQRVCWRKQLETPAPLDVLVEYRLTVDAIIAYGHCKGSCLESEAAHNPSVEWRSVGIPPETAERTAKPNAEQAQWSPVRTCCPECGLKDGWHSETCKYS